MPQLRSPSRCFASCLSAIASTNRLGTGGLCCAVRCFKSCKGWLLLADVGQIGTIRPARGSLCSSARAPRPITVTQIRLICANFENHEREKSALQKFLHVLVHQLRLFLLHPMAAIRDVAHR